MAGFSGIVNISVPGFQLDFPVIANIIVMVNLLIGLLTLKFAVDQSVAITAFHRRAGRIRKYFRDMDREVSPYLAFALALLVFGSMGLVQILYGTQALKKQEAHEQAHGSIHFPLGGNRPNTTEEES